jgi:DNA polymerase-1
MKKLLIEGSPEVKQLADIVLKQRKADKLANTYFKNFLDDNVNGFVHPSVKTMGARTGRMSITNPALQTLPKGDDTVRRAFLPKDDDHVIITSDLDQVEFRMFASLSQDPNLISLFNLADATGSDPFTEIGREIYQDPSMVKSDKRRSLIKGVVYGRLYGAGVAKQALTAGVPEDQMRAVSDAFDLRFPGMTGFQKQVEDVGMRRLRAEGQGYVNTWTGRRLPCDEDRVYTLVNYLIQGGAAEVFKSNLVKLDKADLTDLLIVPVHDEIVLNAPREDAKEIMQIVRECMTTRDGWSVPLTADVDGPLENWGQKYV